MACGAGCAMVTVKPGRAEPLPEATRAKALGSFKAEGACGAYNPLAGGVQFHPLSTDGTNLDDPSVITCAAQMWFTPDGEGLLVGTSGKLRRYEWRTGKVVWTREASEGGVGGAWTLDGRWFVVPAVHGEPERMCWPFFEHKAEQFCDPQPHRRARPVAVDLATGRDAVGSGAVKVGWTLTPYRLLLNATARGLASKLVDIGDGRDTAVAAPGERFNSADAMSGTAVAGTPSRWLGPMDFDQSLAVSLWLRLTPLAEGVACDGPRWALNVVAVRGGAPVWTRELPCVSPFAQVSAWYSADGQHVGVPYSLVSGIPASVILDAATGEVVSDLAPIGEFMPGWIAAPAGSPLTARSIIEAPPVASETGIAAWTGLDRQAGGGRRAAYVLDVRSGAVVNQLDFGFDDTSDSRTPSVTISRDGKLLALFDTTGTVTVVPTGAP